MPISDHQETCCSGRSAALDFAGPKAQPHYPPDITLEPIHLELRLRVDLETQSAEGTVLTTLLARAEEEATIRFHAVDLAIHEVTSEDGEDLRWAYDGSLLEATWDKPWMAFEKRKLRIRYSVTQPKNGLHFSGPTLADPTAPRLMFSDHETERARHWLPCVDLPAVRTALDLYLTAPQEMTILANGSLLSEESHDDQTKTAHWHLSQRSPSYLLCLAIGDFIKFEDEPLGEIPIASFASSRYNADLLRRTFGPTRKMLDWMAQLLGTPYPFPKYYQIALPGVMGAMENISLVTWDERFLLDETLEKEWRRLIDQINVHEMAHSYFGDLVVCRDHSHAWLKESWATYMEICWLEASLGDDEMAYELFSCAQAYIDEADQRYKRPIVTRTYQSSWEMYDRHLYPGGACRLHMLRQELGDAVFWTAVQDYLQCYAEEVVETEDFRRVMEEHSGRSLVRFFDEWFYTPGYPAVKVGFSYDTKAKEGTFVLEQTQADKATGKPVFLLKPDLAWKIDGQMHSQQVKFERPQMTVIIPMEKAPEMVFFDPKGRCLTKTTLAVGEPILKKLLTDAPDVTHRILAARELASAGTLQGIEALREAYRKEAFWGVRVRIAEALGKSGTEAAFQALLALASEEKHPMVCEATFAALGKYKDPRSKGLLQERLLEDLPYRAKAEICKSLGNCREEAPTALLVEMAKTPSFHGIVQSGALLGLGQARQTAALDALRSLILPGEIATLPRVSALQALAEAARLLPIHEREVIAENVLARLRDPIPHIRLTAARSLGSFRLPHLAGAIDAFAKTLTWQDRLGVEGIARSLHDTASAESPSALQKQIETLEEKLRKLEDRALKTDARLEALTSKPSEPPAP